MMIEKHNCEQITRLLALPLLQLIALADSVRKENQSSGLDVCSIMNIKSGSCTEDCRFCAQSSHYNTSIESFPLRSKDKILKAAERAKHVGAERFGLVASGRAVPHYEIDDIAETINMINEKIGIRVCASLGVLGMKDLDVLKQAGLSRYHHNIETSRRYFPEICTTHKYDDRINTIKAARDAGLEVCSGGLIGIGENWQDRIDMAFQLRELDVTAVPVNILVPIKGTPLEYADTVSCADVIRTIAIFRLVLRERVIKIAAGRESILKDFQALAFMSGANGLFVDGYLTLKGRDIADDHRLIEEITKMWQQG